MIGQQDRMGDRLDEAQLRYLQAADSAAQRRYDDAENEFIAALHLNPSLHTARFQLGLLQLTCAHPDKAQATWVPLHQASSPAELRHFVLGLEALIVDNFKECVAQLQVGISLNTTNAALNRDMEMMITRIHEVLKANAAANTTVVPAETTAKEPVRTDFSLYGKS